MKLLKIKKTYRNGEKIHYMFFDNDVEDWYVDNYVENWGEKESSGRVYGYELEWEFIEDKDKLRELIQRRIKAIKTELSVLLEEGERLENFLNPKPETQFTD